MDSSTAATESENQSAISSTTDSYTPAEVASLKSKEEQGSDPLPGDARLEATVTDAENQSATSSTITSDLHEPATTASLKSKEEQVLNPLSEDAQSDVVTDAENQSATCSTIDSDKPAEVASLKSKEEEGSDPLPEDTRLEATVTDAEKQSATSSTITNDLHEPAETASLKSKEEQGLGPLSEDARPKAVNDADPTSDNIGSFKVTESVRLEDNANNVDNKAKCLSVDTLSEIISEKECSPEMDDEDVEDDSWMDQWIIDDPPKQANIEATKLAQMAAQTRSLLDSLNKLNPTETALRTSKATDKAKGLITSLESLIPANTDQFTEGEKCDSTNLESNLAEVNRTASSTKNASTTSSEKNQPCENTTKEEVSCRIKEPEKSPNDTLKPTSEFKRTQISDDYKSEDQMVSGTKPRKSMEELAASTNALLESVRKRFPELAEKKTTKPEARKSQDVNMVKVYNLLLRLQKEVASIQIQTSEMQNKLRSTSDVLQETLEYVQKNI